MVFNLKCYLHQPRLSELSPLVSVNKLKITPLLQTLFPPNHYLNRITQHVNSISSTYHSPFQSLLLNHHPLEGTTMG